MGRCIECNKDTGWFGFNRCSEHNIELGKELTVASGFYAGKKGKILTRKLERMDGLGGERIAYYKIDLGDNESHWVDERDF